MRTPNPAPFCLGELAARKSPIPHPPPRRSRRRAPVRLATVARSRRRRACGLCDGGHLGRCEGRGGGRRRERGGGEGRRGEGRGREGGEGEGRGGGGRRGGGGEEEGGGGGGREEKEGRGGGCLTFGSWPSACSPMVANKHSTGDWLGALCAHWHRRKRLHADRPSGTALVCLRSQAARAGLIIETVTERHAAPYAGTHARYVLRTAVEIVQAV